MRVASTLKNLSMGLLGAGAAISIGIALAQPIPPAANNAAGYPPGAIPITASATGTTAAISATLPAAQNKTTYICGFTLTANATAGISALASLGQTVTANMLYQQPVAVSPAVAILQQTFTPCIPASGANTVIQINGTAPGAGGNSAAYAWGFQL